METAAVTATLAHNIAVVMTDNLITTMDILQDGIKHKQILIMLYIVMIVAAILIRGCTKHHTQDYSNGYYDGYSKLWAQWQYNLAHGLNLVNSPTQDQTSGVNTNIKCNDSTVTNIINHGQASNSPNTASSGYGGNR